ncbi:glycosyltransferase family 9 protein [Enterobacillus tribolii]|uniref:ADP-heptose:LPS heptosyltransferase n=1 Tax=Enterobacillus tribolii TaxID=1487935 RepID=A0A370R4I6_9GAMM|nr:glycosyltransferase family 9 protein [Enterobacillus tribolii]MBW7983283.1 lipopolysaccharide heptosyltransferase family protein [Enterobacillus tribolii]RDK97341.1 ADP-heptose:LPS heptosyltransferase [Enterobacillus tribolii]
MTFVAKKFFKKLTVLNDFIKQHGNDLRHKILLLSVKKLMASKPALRDISTIAIIMPTKGIGDGIIFSGLYKYFSTLGKKVFIVCSERTAFFYAKSPYVSGVVTYSDDISRKTIKQITAERIDLAIDMYGDDLRTPQRIRTLYALMPEYSVAFNGNGISRGCFSHTIDYKKLDTHLTDRANALFDFLGSPKESINYTLPLSGSNDDAALNFLQHVKGKKICFSPFASNFNRSLSAGMATEIAQKLAEAGTSVILMGSAEQLREINVENSKVVKLPEMTFFDACAVIKACDLLLSVDTAFVHVGNALNKPSVTLYNMEMWDDFTINIVFGPNYADATKIISESYLVRDINTEEIVSSVTTRLAAME